MKTAFIFPGQGSQYIGMGKLLYQKFDVAKKIFNLSNDILGYDIKEICFTDKNNLLNKTKYTQPAIFIYSIILDTLLKENNKNPQFVAGHSLGEYSALVSAGYLNFERALYLIKIRSELMQKSDNNIVGSMAAILNEDTKRIQKMIDDYNYDITIANYNSDSQIIISGEKKSINNFIKIAKSNKIRKIIPLNVSGAFHSPLMKNVRINLEKFINSTVFYDTKIPIYQNFNPKQNLSIEIIKNNLINQIDNPVRWNETILNMKKDDVKHYIEVGPKNILTNLNKKIIPNLQSENIENKIEFFYD